MAKPYQSEMARLAETLDWARSVDLSALETAVQTALLGPLVAIGSGGSLSTAHALAQYHRLASSHVSTVLTPLESVAVRHDSGTALWLLSASGNNVDVVRAAKALAVREPRQLSTLVGREGSKVERITQTHSYMDLLTYVLPTGKDGFLATNTLLGATAILGRAYSAAAPSLAAWESEDLLEVVAGADNESATVDHWRAITQPLWNRDTTVVLPGANGTLGAVDLESKFTEAAVGHAQIADFRNFAHGRHHWLAKRGDRSGVLALIGDDDQDIAERTLAQLPPGIPVARIRVPGSPVHASLVSLIAAFRLTDWAGQARGIDPGDPGVPEFGRRIYHLAPSRKLRSSRPSSMSLRSVAAIERKTGRNIEQLTSSSEIIVWKDALRLFQRTLTTAVFSGIVLDYDGTVVDTRYRFSPPSSEITTELIRLLAAGIPIGIATGRGQSARHALQEAIPKHLWSRVILGYYNGAEVGTLNDDSVPQADQRPTQELREIAKNLLKEPELIAQATQEHRRDQLTITSQGNIREDRLWEIVQSVVQRSLTKPTVLRSSHSVDVLSSAATKLHVTTRMHEISPTGSILTIGDRGRWPGNDHELLSLPLSLSVDQSSPARDTCWNLGAPGQRGPAITIEYLRALISTEEGNVRFEKSALR